MYGTDRDKLSSVAALHAEYVKLIKQKETLYVDYGELKKQVNEYEIINIDNFLKIER